MAQLTARPQVRIQSAATFIEQLFPFNFLKKGKSKVKEAANGPFKSAFATSSETFEQCRSHEESITVTT